jgi:eukaryotic-like serine/threonine-protein kinase
MPEADSTPDPKPAPRLGSYLLVQALGSGGMSNVFRAVHEETGSVVAVKVLPRTLAKNATLLQRFMREAKSAESLDHPNIVAIYDRGFDQGRHYLVLEYVEGRDLHDRVRLNGPLGAEEAVTFVREVAEGLRYAAGQGMIHRDVKPANLLMTPDGHAKIIDLGLALQIEDEDERVTRDGTTVGTVDYMAPEQARDSRQTSERSDIYSLGCTFYYLMTGSPPYPGGGLSDKLARHYKAPIPDVREHRPDIPESLSGLIRKMMEKKPERRFADYTQLIEALDTMDDPPTQDITGDEPLDALIVDDDEDDEIGLAPTETALSRSRDDRPPSGREPILMAEIVDDDDDDDAPAPTLPPPGPRPRSGESPKRPQPAAPAAPAELSLAELAALDADDPPARRPSPRPSSSGSMTKAASSPAQPAARTPAFGAIPDEEEEDEEVYGSQGAVSRGPGQELSIKTWVAAGVMVGLSIAIVAFAASMILSLTKPEKAPERADRTVEETSEAEPPTPPPAYPPGRSRGEVAPRPKNNAFAKAETKAPLPTPAPVPVPVAPLEEKTYPADWESKLGPPPSIRSGSTVDNGPRTVVRRVIQAGNEPQTASLASAFSRAGDLVEIADVGPFFEDDLQVAGKSRLIRARGGVRPMIKVEYTGNEIIKDQAAKFILGGAKVDSLIFEGIDFAVNVRDLPDHQSTLFLCQGADLTLRDCSVTILNANDAARANRFSVFRVEEGAKPNRIVLERTSIRGPIGTLIDLAASRAEVVMSRSLILGDAFPLIVAQPAEKGARSFHFYRSLLVSRGNVMELVGRSNPPSVRSLGTTFARLEGGNGSAPGLVSSRVDFTGEPPSALDWSGEDNDFIGWSGLLTAGPQGSVRVAGLDGINATWIGSDASSRETATAWPAPNRPDVVSPVEFAALTPPFKATLVKVATPSGRFNDLTFGSLAKLSTPELSATLIPPFVPPVIRPGAERAAAAPKPAALPPPNPNALGPRPKGKAAGPQPKGAAPPGMQGANPPAQPPGPLNLTFDVKEAPWAGDLGLYLAEKLVAGVTRATVQVRGAGVHPMSPIRLPDGLSIAILGNSIEGSNLAMPTFVPKTGSVGRTMFELHGGDLAIANLSFSTEGATRPKHWVLSEDGLLAIRHCRFRDPAPNTNASISSAAPDLGPLIVFVAKGTAPIPPRVGPFVKETDRPTARLKNCLIWTAGDAISADVGRGVVDLENCLIISGGPAVTLLPRDVARDKFEADLVFDRCTIAVDKTAVFLGPLAGDPTGPSRPWLVSSRRCAFPRTQQPGAPGALLQVDADAMARGVLFWQSTSDYYDSHRFLTPTGLQPANSPSAEVKKQWMDIWGQEHTKMDRGPTLRQNEVVLRYKDKEKPKPGKVVPAALELDKALKDIGVEFKDLPHSTKGAVETPPAGRGTSGPAPERS